MNRRYSVILKYPDTSIESANTSAHVEFVEAESPKEAARLGQFRTAMLMDWKDYQPEDFNVLIVAAGFIDVRLYGEELKDN